MNNTRPDKLIRPTDRKQFGRPEAAGIDLRRPNSVTVRNWNGIRLGD